MRDDFSETSPAPLAQGVAQALLQEAAAKGDWEGALRALALKADPDRPGLGGRAPAGHLAVRSGKPFPPSFWDACDARRPWNESTLPLLAAEHGNDGALEALWPRADAAATDGIRGRDALMTAAAFGREKTVAFLAPRCDATRRDASGFTALLDAVKNFRLALIPLLLPVSDAGATTPHGDSAFGLLRLIVEREGVAGSDAVEALDILAASNPEDPCVQDFKDKAPLIHLPRHNAWAERRALSAAARSADFSLSSPRARRV